MIEIKNVSKTFDNVSDGNDSKINAVNSITLDIRENACFGLVGTNGSGKSTLLRMISDVYRPDTGTVTVDGKRACDHAEVKQNVFYLSDDPFFFRNADPEDMINFYAGYYPEFDKKRCLSLLHDFEIDCHRKISGFSKGMRKQFFMLCGLCSGAKYLLCDEIFDGLDPVIRQSVKSVIGNDMLERALTPVIASHNLRELEDICDGIGLMHKGELLLSEELEQLRENLHKVQCVFSEETAFTAENPSFSEKIRLLGKEENGRLCTFTVEGEKKQIEAWVHSTHTVFSEILPLTLEEIFISKAQEVGYNAAKIL